MKNFFLLLITFMPFFVLGQDTSEEVDSTKHNDKYIHFYNDKDPLAEFAPEEEEKDFKEKKPKRKVFYGLKTKKGFTKSGYGSRMKISVFYYLKDQTIEPVPYIKDIYVFDFDKYEVDRVNEFKPEDNEFLLHGPYKLVVDGETIEEGIYYKGVKHGRWTEYAKPDEKTFKDTIDIEYKILKSKEKYNRGWPKDTELEYWDAANTKLKIAIPIVHGERDGYYVSYYQSGRMEEQGNYILGYKAGYWLEYYDKGRLTSYRKRQIKYERNPMKDGTKGQIIKEWDDEGSVIYDYEREQKLSKEELPMRFVEDEEEAQQP